MRPKSPPYQIARILASWAENTMNDEAWDDLLDAELPPDADGEYLWHVAGILASIRQGIKSAEAAINRRRVADIEAHGPVRFGDTFITYAPDNKRRITDKDALLGWLDQAGEQLGVANLATEVFRISDDNLRITTLRRVAERYYAHQEPQDTDEEATAEYVQMIEDTFTTWDEGDPKLKEIPIDKAPKYAQKLEHGHRAGSFKNQKSEVEKTDSKNEK